MKRIIKRFRIDKRIRVGYGSAFLILLLSYLLTLYSNKKMAEEGASIKHTNDLITRLDNFLSLMKDAEIGSRGYFLTRDKTVLDSYYKSRMKSGPSFYELHAELMNSPDQIARMKKAKKLLDKKYESIDSTINTFDRNGYRFTDSLLAIESNGKATMDSLRAVITEMQNTEKDVLARRTEKLGESFHLVNIIIVISLIVALLLFVFGFITYVAENRARRLADIRAEEYRQELEERVKQLDKANKELLEMRRLEKFTATGRIARTIAHEVRNPLTNINLSVDQLKSGMEGDEDRQVFYDMILRNSQRINSLITELLDSTKFVEVSPGPLPINTLLDETLLFAADRIKLKNIQVIKEYSKDICDVAVDKEKMKIAFLNIIVNAIEAMEGEGGQLVIKTYSQNNKCIVEISDNGSGMDEEALNKLFEPYYSRKNRGTGLGLTNTENIILSHKGSINVESSLGKGTTFTITLNFA
jgi:signal transduction histidine kinase